MSKRVGQTLSVTGLVGKRVLAVRVALKHVHPHKKLEVLTGSVWRNGEFVVQRLGGDAFGVDDYSGHVGLAQHFGEG